MSWSKRIRRTALLIGTALLVASPARAQDAPLVINEIFYNPADDGERHEFVELYNRSGRAVELGSYALADANREPAPMPARTLPPGGYLVLARDASALRAAFPDVTPVELDGWPALNNGGDTVFLLHAGTVADSVACRPSWGGENGRSLERIDPGGPARAFNFGTSTAEAGATPGTQNSLFAPDTAPPAPLFAEQTAPMTVIVFFDEPLDPASVASSAFAVEGRGAATADLLENPARVRLTFSPYTRGGSLVARGVRDLVGNVLNEAAVPTAAPPRPGEVVINEILYAPRADDFDDRPDQPEYVELYNRADVSLTLRGAFWTDRPDEEGEADTLHFGRNQLVGIPPGGFAIVYASPEPEALVEAFPALDTSAARRVLIGLDRSSLGLLNGGSLIHLRRRDGAVLDSVFYDPDWHVSGLEDDTGVALERLDPGGPSNDPANWTSSVAVGGGTPGRPNSVRLPPGAPPVEAGLEVLPSPFSPDGDGHEDVTAIRYVLGAPASLLRLRIFDSYGREVYSVEAQLGGREGRIPWDGRDSDDRRLRIGIYVVLLEALDAEGGTVATYKAPVVLARPLN